VVVSSVDLPIGTGLQRNHFKLVDLPLEAAPAGSFDTIDDLLKGQPTVVNTAIAAGEVVLPGRLSTGITKKGLTSRIPDGLRAISIPVNAVRGVGGFILPGDRVDVLHTTAVGRKDEQPVTRTLLQDITVLGVDQLSSNLEEEPVVANVVTLLSTPEQSKKLTLAQQAGTLTLALRNGTDKTDDSSDTIALNNLWNYGLADDSPAPAPTPVAQIPNYRSVQVIRGLNVNKQAISGSETLVSN
jgi:pilus assembly protein CpaB